MNNIADAWDGPVDFNRAEQLKQWFSKSLPAVANALGDDDEAQLKNACDNLAEALSDQGLI